METHLADWLKGTPDGVEAESILRRCVHCGFCTATCPTYQLLGDELDGPRGRIYLMKQVIEGAKPTHATLTHLDRCLTCRNCETTCPSGVEYGHLVDIGRRIVESKVKRPLSERLMRSAVKELTTRRGVFKQAMRIGQALRPAVPAKLRDKVPEKRSAGRWPTRTHARKAILLNGCVQPYMVPSIDAATARVLDALGVQSVVIQQSGCCGAIRYHMNDQAGGLDDMRRNIDAWWPLVSDPAAGVEAIVVNASGCGVMVKDYGHALRHDAAYAEKAARIAALAKDPVEFLLPMVDALRELVGSAQADGRPGAARGAAAPRIAFHPPCTLQHGQKIRGDTERLLVALGVELAPVADAHLCCGSAGTYSITQPVLSRQLRSRKLASLQVGEPEAILSSNVGCITHLQAGTGLPVRHWLEWLDTAIAARPAAGHRPAAAAQEAAAAR